MDRKSGQRQYAYACSAIALLMTLLQIQANDEYVYITLMSDHGQYSGLISSIASMAKNSQQVDRLRLLLIVPEKEAKFVDDALGCLFSGREIERIEDEKVESGRRERSFHPYGDSWKQLSGRGGAYITIAFSAFKHRREIVRSKTNQRLRSPFNYARLYIANLPRNLVPKSVLKLLYLDADVTVLTDIVTLADSVNFASDSHALVAAVPRPQRIICKHLLKCNRTGVIEALAQRNITQPDTQLLDFNAGVLVIALDRWRNPKTNPVHEIEHWIRVNRKLDFFRLGTNPPMVLALRKPLPLAAKWNYAWGIAGLDNVSRLTPEKAAILHFKGAKKPWFLAPNESLPLGWTLPPNSKNCSRELVKLGIYPDRTNRPPFDFKAIGIPTSVLKEHLKDTLKVRHRHHRQQQVDRFNGTNFDNSQQPPLRIVKRGDHPVSLKKKRQTAAHHYHFLNGHLVKREG